MPTKGIRRTALIIANNLYRADSGLQKLIAPPQDAKGLARVLKHPEIGSSEINRMMGRSRSRQQVILLDCSTACSSQCR